jgi:hypothetical protein
MIIHNYFKIKNYVEVFRVSVKYKQILFICFKTVGFQEQK